MSETQEIPTKEVQPKFIAVIRNDNGEIVFNLQGIDFDEAFIIMKKGMAKFEKLYDNWVREQS